MKIFNNISSKLITLSYFIVILISVLVDSSNSKHIKRHLHPHSSSSSLSLDMDENEKMPERSGRFLCMEQQVDIEHLERRCKIKCPKIYAPVCGSDDVTYHNRCFLVCYSKHRYHLFSEREEKLTLKSWGECESDSYDYKLDEYQE